MRLLSATIGTKFRTTRLDALYVEESDAFPQNGREQRRSESGVADVEEPFRVSYRDYVGSSARRKPV